ncbi:hypothetical protein [Streptomyces achromogenes]|jgi:hypothetical protein|uniref:hypothetical protein n=1 Tax=Streptomyces achromogenes TaxID=67255 RepID=UPI003700BE09
MKAKIALAAAVLAGVTLVPATAVAAPSAAVTGNYCELAGGLYICEYGVTAIYYPNSSTSDQFIIGTDWNVWERHFDGSAWSRWNSTGGRARGAIKAYNTGTWQPYIQIPGDDGRTWQRDRFAGRWSGWYPA